MSTVYQCKCFCGAVEFEVSGEPAAMGYCDCKDCAEWAGAPINSFSLWKPESLKCPSGDFMSRMNRLSGAPS